ncbi:uncharacterized protein RSE6_14350 [Rhynchosporium secalis]|uniref:Uncharacterized protein n=1 Tax=Rhynchosporium secalis TaxID=38038 RepID=A0A1E1MV41_RHYSE|nr:uncharacterized protein RSE6_14350 [Rhynchosporium secalis]
MTVLERPITTAITTPADDFPRYTYARRSLTSSSQSMSSTSGPTTPTSPAFIPAPWYHFSFRTVVLISLPLFSLLGLYATLVLGQANGTFKAIIALMQSEKPRLPATDDELLMHYTSIGWLDKQLTILVLFFAPVVEMRGDALSMFTIFGVGQFGAAWTLMVMESFRMGNRGRVVSFVGMFGIIFQNISYTVTVPIWLFIHLLTSPVAKPYPGTHSNTVLLASAWDLRILPISITLGYIVPTILMGLSSPSIVSPVTHQRLIALWQPFPLWTVLIHTSLRTTLQLLTGTLFSSTTNSKGSLPTSRSQIPLGTTYLSNAKHVYRFILALCMLAHLPILVLSLLPSSLISASSFPTLHAMSTQSPREIYIPYLPTPTHKISSLAEGAHTFLIWDVYVGSFAFLLWGILLYRNATMEKAELDPNTSLPIYKELLLGERIMSGMVWRKLAGKVVLWCVLAGPIGALSVLLWERDAIVRRKIKQGI